MKPEGAVFLAAAAAGAGLIAGALVVAGIWWSVGLAVLGSPALVVGATGLWLVAHDPDGIYSRRKR